MSVYDQAPLQEAIKIATPEPTTPGIAEAASSNPVSANSLTDLTNQASSALSNVYSSQNIANAVASPVAKPDFSDPLKLYDFYMNSLDIANTRTETKTLQEQINGLNETLRNTLNVYKNKTMGMNAIRGAQAAASDTAALPLQALSEQLGAKQAYLSTLTADATNKFNIAKEQRDQLSSLISSTGGKAGINYTDTFESAVSKAEKYAEEKRKDDEKDAYKKELRALGLKTSGSRKELEKRLIKYNKSAAADVKKLADLNYQSKLLDIQNTKSIINDRNNGGSGASDQELLTYADMISRGMGDKVPSKNYADAWNLLSDDEKNNSIAGI